MTIYGYARVSTDGQTLDAQRAALVAAGAAKVFHETARGIKSDRKELATAPKVLGAGDTMIVSRLDRLARSKPDLLNRSEERRDGDEGVSALRSWGSP